MKKQLYFIFSILLISLNVSAQDFAIIPKPMELSAGEGKFQLDENCNIQIR